MKLIQHVGLVHAHEPNFTITCGLNNCKSTFKVYESFRRHVYRKHSEHVKPNNQTNEIENLDTGGNDEHPEENEPPCMDTLLVNFKENLCMTIPEINSELQHLAIGQNDLKNKPVQLSERLLQNAAISGSAAQKWCLFRLLPFIMYLKTAATGMCT